MSVRFESPIERLFFETWVELMRDCEPDGINWCLHLHPQREVKVGIQNFRLDFVVGPADLSEDRPFIAVELDGHDFHERTKEQVAYRDWRDRRLQVWNYKVFHISGSALVRDPKACVGDVIADCEVLVVDWMYEQSRVLVRGDGKNQVD